MRPSIRRTLRRVTAVIDRTPRRRRLVSLVLARYYLARGANAVVVADAMSQADDLPIAATRSTLRWSASLVGAAPVPLRYRPDRRLVTPEARSAALQLIEQYLADSEDLELRKHRAYLLSESGPGDSETVDFVRSALEEALSELAVRSPTNRSLAPAAAFEVLAILHNALVEGGMRPFLMSGTLLGVVREGRLLPHDYDLDIGLLPGDASADQVAAVLGDLPGMTITLEDRRVWGRHDSGIDFDVFVHYESDDRYYHVTQSHAWWNSPFALVERELQGQMFLVPDDVETYLSENYGDWRSPSAFFDKSFDTPNREFRQTTHALLYLCDVVLNGSQSDQPDRYLVESAVRELERNFGIDLRHHFGRSALLDTSTDISGTISDR